MSYLVFKLKKKLEFRINLALLIPNKIANKKISAIKSLGIIYGSFLAESERLILIFNIL